MNRTAFIINPFSAGKNYQPFLQKLKEKLGTPIVYISESIDGTHQFIEDNLEKVDIFVAVGGDGTISSVARKLVDTDKVLAIFPAGSGNGFSNETNFSKNLDSLLEKIKQKKTKRIDTFLVNDVLSVNVSGAGFDGKVAKEFEKTSRGFANYIKVSIKTFIKYKPIEIKFDNVEYQKYNGKYLMVNVANTRQFGNNAYIAPHASKSDGLVEIVLVKKFPMRYSAVFAYQLFNKTLGNSQFVTYLSVPEISFNVDTQNWHIDGDYRKMSSPVTIKVLPKNLKILI